jgi:hypothetical protein
MNNYLKITMYVGLELLTLMVMKRNQDEAVASSSACYCFILVSCLGYSVTLKMEATCSSKTLVDFQQTI